MLPTIRIYCSKECQRKHWKTHKSQCSINAQAIKELKEFSPDVNIVELMRGWTAKHRPTLARGLTYAINLHEDRYAYEHRILFMILEYQPQATKAARKFKVMLAEGMEIADLLNQDQTGGYAEMAKSLPEQLKIMGEEARKTHGMLGTGAVVLMAPSEHAVGNLVMPVSLGGPWVRGDDPPPTGWMMKMVKELNGES